MLYFMISKIEFCEISRIKIVVMGHFWFITFCMAELFIFVKGKIELWMRWYIIVRLRFQ